MKLMHNFLKVISSIIYHSVSDRAKRIIALIYVYVRMLTCMCL